MEYVLPSGSCNKGRRDCFLWRKYHRGAPKRKKTAGSGNDRPSNKSKNRAAFESEIVDWIEEKEAFTLYLIGLDNFKYLNDLYGHLYGDILLEKMGNVLSRAFSGCRIYKWSGDEFLIVDEKSEVGDVNRMIRSIMSLVINKWSLKDIEYSSSASVGIVRYPYNGLTLSNLASIWI